MLQAVIFDIDGTLVDSVDLHARAWQEAFAHFGHAVPFDRIRYQIGKGGDKLLPEFLSAAEIEQRGKEIETYRGKLFKSEYFAQCRPFPRVRELFERLRGENLTIALASSGKKDDVKAYEKMLHIEDLVTVAITADDVKNSKPDPDVLEVARQELGNLSARQCVFVGDSPHDAAAARKDGMLMIGVLCGGFSEQDLRQAGASEIFRDPEDLLHLSGGFEQIAQRG